MATHRTPAGTRELRRRRRWGAVALTIVAGTTVLAARPATGAGQATSTLVSSSNGPGRAGYPVTLRAVITTGALPGDASMGGTVSFTGTGVSGCTSRPITQGVASCQVSWDAVGSYVVTAAYSGDASHASSSGQHTQQITVYGDVWSDPVNLTAPCGTWGSASLPHLPLGGSFMETEARGGAGGLSATNANGTPAAAQGGIARLQLPYEEDGTGELNYLVGCGGGSGTVGVGSPSNGGAGWGAGGSGGATTTSGPRGGGGGGGTVICRSTSATDHCATGTPYVVGGGGGGAGPGVLYGGGAGGGGGGSAAGAKGGGCANALPSAGSAGSAASSAPWYASGSITGTSQGGSGGGGGGCGSNLGGAGGGGGGGTGGAGGDRCCTAATGGTGGGDSLAGGGGSGATGAGAVGAVSSTSGGNGGAGAATSGTGATGGGGGGGYTGGGGGGAGNNAGTSAGPGGGGGGGASWALTAPGGKGQVLAGTGQVAGEAGYVKFMLFGARAATASGTQSIASGTPVDLVLPTTAYDPHPGTTSVVVSAANLPVGLSIDASGRVTGTPTVMGTYASTTTVTTVHSTDGTVVVSDVVVWTVGPPTSTTSTSSSTTTTSTSTTTTTPTSTSTTTSSTTTTTTPTTSTSSTTTTTTPTSTSTSTTTTTPTSTSTTTSSTTSTSTSTTTTTSSTTTTTTPTSTTSTPTSTTTTTPTSTSTTTTTPTSTTTTSTTTTTAPCTTDLTPFASLSALVGQLYADVAGRAPTAAEQATWTHAVGTCDATVDDLAVSLLPTSQSSTDARLVRLYLAYFKRPPDPDGFTYWKRQLESGRGLINAALKFARSSEFTRTYGSLSNAAFVDLVYQNVLGRAGDASGRSYWITRLDRGTKNRGEVMINFSESTENTTKKADHVAVFRLYRAMLARFPGKTAYLALLDPVLADTSTLEDVARTLRHDPAYAARF